MVNSSLVILEVLIVLTHSSKILNSNIYEPVSFVWQGPSLKPLMSLPCYLVSQPLYEDGEFARHINSWQWFIGLKCLGVTGLLSYASLTMLNVACWNPWRPAQKTWTITTIDWLRLSSKSELCDGSLPTETTHNTIMLHWGKKKGIQIIKVKQCFLFLYTCKNVVSVYSNDRQF